MAGRRPLTKKEEHRLIKVARKSDPRTRAFITTQLYTGFRAFEVASLTIGQVYRGGRIVPKIGITPKFRKGHYGHTHWVPVGGELNRALTHYLARRVKEEGILAPSAPLFVSRKHDERGRPRPITRHRAHQLVRHAFTRAGIEDDGCLGTHTLRKTFCMKVFHLSGHNLIVTRNALGHRSVATTEKYLECTREEVDAVILRGDWSRRPRQVA